MLSLLFRLYCEDSLHYRISQSTIGMLLGKGQCVVRYMSSEEIITEFCEMHELVMSIGEPDCFGQVLGRKSLGNTLIRFLAKS